MNLHQKFPPRPGLCRFAMCASLAALLMTKAGLADALPELPEARLITDEKSSNQPPLPPAQSTALQSVLPEKAVTQPAQGEVSLLDGNWKMEIRPAAATPIQVNEKSYSKIYNAIPFRRSEYLANPSYRHDTTVEIMFGQMRPTVIHRQNLPQTVVNPRPQTYDASMYRAMEYWRYPGRFIQLLPGFGPIPTPRLVF